MALVAPAATNKSGHKAATLTLITTVGIQAIGLVTGILVARVLGVEGRGQLAAVVLWASLVTYLGDLGIPLSFTYEAARNPDSLPVLVGNGMLLSIVQWLILALLGGPVVWWALGRIGTSTATLGVLYLVMYLPLNLTTRYVMSIFQGRQMFIPFNAIRVIVPLSYAVSLIAILFSQHRTVQGVLLANILSNVVACGLALILATIVLVRRFGAPRYNIGLLRENIMYGLKAHIGNLTPIDGMRLDLLLVTAVLGAYDAGLYSVATSAAMVIRAQGTALGMVTLPAVAAERELYAKRNVLASYVRLTLVLTGTTSLVACLFARPLIVLLYGPAYAGAAPVMQILVVGIVAAAVRQVVGDGLRGLGHPGAATVAEICSWGIAAVALALLVPPLGVRGGALAVSMAYAAALFVCILQAVRLGIPWKDLLLPRRSDVRLLLSLVRSLSH